ncbi:MAG: thiamine-phosphate kinase [Deltaproteobacteria bacterium]|nr:thiamine-phosphate kinase [Deltaproteobacteria bacterium]
MTEWEMIQKFARGAEAIGDDCAVLEKDATHDWLITTDTLQEGVHFWRALTTFEQLGWKALAVSVSDINAMGGESKQYLLSVGLPSSVKPKDIEGLAKGLAALEKESRVTLIGGNTTRTADGIVITTTVLGTVPKGKAILRRGAGAGDAIYVTGTFGGASAGLLCLERVRHLEQPLRANRLPFVERQLSPRPPLQVGPWLRETGSVTSMIDVSDGLLADLTHIAEASKVGYVLEEARVPTQPGFEEVVRELKGDSILLKLTGGEDYELLFTVREQDVTRFERSLQDAQKQFAVSMTRVGTVVTSDKIRRVNDAAGNERKLSQLGFDHFAGG